MAITSASHTPTLSFNALFESKNPAFPRIHMKRRLNPNEFGDASGSGFGDAEPMPKRKYEDGMSHKLSTFHINDEYQQDGHALSITELNNDWCDLFDQESASVPIVEHPIDESPPHSPVGEKFEIQNEPVLVLTKPLKDLIGNCSNHQQLPVYKTTGKELVLYQPPPTYFPTDRSHVEDVSHYDDEFLDGNNTNMPKIDYDSDHSTSSISNTRPSTPDNIILSSEAEEDMEIG